jgi:hypothetical protein
MSSPDDKKQQVDFSLIRDLQKYSQSSQDRFFADSDMCFLYLWFVNNESSEDFVNGKVSG